MSKKTEFDDFEEFDSPEILSPESCSVYGGSYDPSYVPLKIEEVERDLSEKSKKVITECTEVFFKTGEISKPEYVKAIEDIEVMNLEMMLNQVKVSAHMINSLVRRLNESGTTELALFRTIMEAQNHALALTMNVSSYVRNLPGFFKGLKFELSPGLPELTDADLEQQKQIKEKEGIQDEMSINAPQLGTKDLLKMLDDAEKQREEAEKENEFIENDLSSLQESPKNELDTLLNQDNKPNASL